MELQTVYNALLAPCSTDRRTHFGNFFSRTGKINKAKPSRKGLYLWGGVGRGKTHLVDYFFKLIPSKKKLRLHFHRFMQLVHEDLATLKHVEDPLQTVAKNLSHKADIICLDEMHVNDITDAMLLGKLFEHLFEQNVVLVTTSNRPPQD
ncbi:PREDICTED: cell division protein ZapE-like, partial [Priapulus caudatus]|uniref:Cell division protein ZapE-like n=1 Tax=Priapulus caudatus TaxID=37621 RepID=A0ABM1F7W3_PRICU